MRKAGFSFRHDIRTSVIKATPSRASPIRIRHGTVSAAEKGRRFSRSCFSFGANEDANEMIYVNHE